MIKDENMINKHDPSKSKTSSLSSLMYLFLFVFAIITFLGACSLQDDKIKTVGSEIWETTDSFDELPTFLNDHTEHTAQLYGQVHEHTHILGMIDCYCGCMEGSAIDEPHDSLLRCYLVQHPTEEGTITWTDHSTMCGICKQELELVIDMANKGSTDDEIIAAIQSTFSPSPHNH